MVNCYQPVLSAAIVAYVAGSPVREGHQVVVTLSVMATATHTRKSSQRSVSHRSSESSEKPSSSYLTIRRTN